MYCLQIRQKPRTGSQSEENRPASDGTAYDTTSIVLLRDKHRTQVYGIFFRYFKGYTLTGKRSVNILNLLYINVEAEI